MAERGWDGATYTASDGRTYGMGSEHIRGELRFYYLQRVGCGSRGEIDSRVRGSEDKRTAMRRIERYAEERAGG